MTYACIALVLGLAVALYFVRHEIRRRVDAERMVKTLFDVDGWHADEAQDVVKGSATWKMVNAKEDAVSAPYFQRPMVVPKYYGREVMLALNQAERYGRNTAANSGTTPKQ